MNYSSLTTVWQSNPFLSFFFLRHVSKNSSNCKTKLLNLSLFHEPEIFRVVWNCSLGTYFRSNVFEAWWRRILFQLFLDRRNLVSTPNLMVSTINFDNSNSCQISSVEMFWFPEISQLMSDCNWENDREPENYWHAGNYPLRVR